MTQNRMLSGGFKLGTFSTNCSSGMTPTQAPDRWVNSWDNNLALAKLLDAAGIDFMLPIARWIGYGGPTDFHGGVLETMTWAAGLCGSVPAFHLVRPRDAERHDGDRIEDDDRNGVDA